jgi:hypothetical protein
MRSSRNLIIVVALGAMTIAVPELPLFAQESGDYPTPCDASKVTSADVDRAHTVFLSGKQYLEESNYDKAISYFRDAYSIDCSRHAMLPIIATAYERKGDKAEAVRALEEYVRRAPGNPDHDVIERRIKNMKDQLARDQPPVAAPAPSATVTASTAPPPVPPPVEATASTGAPATTAPPPPTGEGHTAAPWVLTGVGGATAITGAVFLVVGAGELSTAESQCPNRVCKSQDSLDSGNRARFLSNLGGILLGSGLAVGGAGLLWHFLERPAGHASSAAATRPHVDALAVPGYAGISLRGGF